MKRTFRHKIEDGATKESFVLWQQEVLPLIEKRFETIITNIQKELSEIESSNTPEPNKEKEADQVLQKAEKEIEAVVPQVQDQIKNVIDAAPEGGEGDQVGQPSKDGQIEKGSLEANWLEENNLKNKYNEMAEFETRNKAALENASSWDEIKDSLSFLSPPQEGQDFNQWKTEVAEPTMVKMFQEVTNNIKAIITGTEDADDQKIQKVSDTIDNYISDSSKKEPRRTDSEEGG